MNCNRWNEHQEESSSHLWNKAQRKTSANNETTSNLDEINQLGKIEQQITKIKTDLGIHTDEGVLRNI